MADAELVHDRLTFDGKGKGVFIDEDLIREWFADHGHWVEILPGLVIFRAAGQPHYPPHTAFIGETIVWDPNRKHLYVRSTMVQPSE